MPEIVNPEDGGLQPGDSFTGQFAFEMPQVDDDPSPNRVLFNFGFADQRGIVFTNGTVEQGDINSDLAEVIIVNDGPNGDSFSFSRIDTGTFDV